MYFLDVFYTHFLFLFAGSGFVLFCNCEIFLLKKIKKFKTELITSFMLLLREVKLLASLTLYFFTLTATLKVQFRFSKYWNVLATSLRYQNFTLTNNFKFSSACLWTKRLWVHILFQLLRTTHLVMWLQLDSNPEPLSS